MKVFKPTYTARDGRQKKCQRWYISFTDRRDRWRRLPAFTSKRASEKAAAMIEELISSGGVFTPELQRWIENLPEKMRSRLVDWQLIDSQRVSENLGKPLDEHLQDFCDGLTADGRKAVYVNQTKKTIEGILKSCKFKVWSDIDGNKVKTHLAKLRGSAGYGERTYNAYLRAFKEFCRWLINENRVAGTDPMRGHSLIRQTEFRKRRRALTVEQVNKLLEATAQADKRFNMTGQERALVYRLALETGLRAGEIKSLRARSFDFESVPCTVHVEPSDTKGKKAADLILIDTTAAALKALLANKMPEAKAFAMPHTANTAAMLKKDLAVAEIPYTDDSGRDCDFHSLRHTFITNLAAAGVHPAVAQKLARHSSIELTMKYYTHILHTSEVAAIDALRQLSAQEEKRAKRVKKVTQAG